MTLTKVAVTGTNVIGGSHHATLVLNTAGSAPILAGDLMILSFESKWSAPSPDLSWAVTPGFTIIGTTVDIAFTGIAARRRQILMYRVATGGEYQVDVEYSTRYLSPWVNLSVWRGAVGVPTNWQHVEANVSPTGTPVFLQALDPAPPVQSKLMVFGTLLQATTAGSWTTEFAGLSVSAGFTRSHYTQSVAGGASTTMVNRVANGGIWTSFYVPEVLPAVGWFNVGASAFARDGSGWF